MGDLIEAEQETGEPVEVQTGRKRERSGIEFPYTDLERAIDLSRTLRNEGGQSKINQTQLAVAWTSQPPVARSGGACRRPRCSGLVDTEQGMVWLTPLGCRRSMTRLQLQPRLRHSSTFRSTRRCLTA